MAVLRRMTAAGVLEAEIPLDRAELTLGRGQECDVVIGEKLVSRRHAKIVRTAQGGHLLLDEQSNIGVMMGDTKVTHRELREGDVFQIGLTKFQYTGAGGAARAKPKGGKGWAIVAVVLVLVVAGGAAAALLLVGRGGKGGTTAPSSAMSPMGSHAFRDAAHRLASQVAALNRAQAAVIAPGGDVDAELAEVALKAIDAGRTARQLSDTVAVQAPSAASKRAWAQHQAAARAAYAAAVVAESSRARLADPRVAEVLPTVMAELQQRLSNPEVAAPTAAPTQDIPVPEDTEVWMSSATEADDAEIPFDREAVTTAQAREAITALTAMGADYDGKRVVVGLFAGISITDLTDKAIEKAKSYVPGEVTKVAGEVAGKAGAEVIQGYAEDFLAGAKANPLNPDLRVSIADKAPASVGIVIGRVNRPSDAPGKVQIDVTWTSPGGGELTIICQLPGYGFTEVPAKGSGSTRVEITIKGTPSTTLGVVCTAKDDRGVTVGYKETELEPRHDPLVDAAVPDGGAPVLDAAPPAAPDAAAKPVDAALGDAWIEPYCAAFEADLLKKRPDDAAAIASVVDDLRVCLKAAVAAGVAEAAAKSQCAKALKEGKTFEPQPDGGAATVTTATGWPGTYVGQITGVVTDEKGKRHNIGNAQTMTVTQAGDTVTLTNKEGEVVKLALSADGNSASGKHEVHDVSAFYTFTLSGDTLTMAGKFTDTNGGTGTMGGTLTRQ